MRVAVATENDYYWELAREYLNNICGELSNLTCADFDSGRVYQLNPQAIIFDMACEKFCNSDVAIDFIEQGLVPCIIVENDVKSMANLNIAAHFRKLSEELVYSVESENIELVKVAGEKSRTPLWVLCSSSGGPSSLNDLVSQIRDPLDCCILVVQHINAEGLQMLTSTLRRHIIGWEIVLSSSNPRVAPGRVIICDPASELTIGEGGRCISTAHSKEQKFYPSIDQTLQNLVEGYGANNMNVAVLTGMGSDGAIAAGKHGAKLNRVVAQTAETCAVKSMPEATASSFPDARRMSPLEIGKLINDEHQLNSLETA